VTTGKRLTINVLGLESFNSDRNLSASVNRVELFTVSKCH